MTIRVIPFPEALPAAAPLTLLPMAAVLAAALVAATAMLLWSL